MKSIVSKGLESKNEKTSKN